MLQGVIAEETVSYHSLYKLHTTMSRLEKIVRLYLNKVFI